MIGESEPAGIQVNTFGTGIIDDDAIAARVAAHFDFRPAAIIKAFDLRYQSERHKRGFYTRLAVYGQVGREDMKLPWENTDPAIMLRSQ
jgi:S-adenosylmethionine synthetase